MTALLLLRLYTNLLHKAKQEAPDYIIINLLAAMLGLAILAVNPAAYVAPALYYASMPMMLLAVTNLAYLPIISIGKMIYPSYQYETAHIMHANIYICQFIRIYGVGLLSSIVTLINIIFLWMIAYKKDNWHTLLLLLPLLLFPLIINFLTVYPTIILSVISMLLLVLCAYIFSEKEAFLAAQNLFSSLAGVSILALLTPTAMCSLCGTFASIVPLCFVAFAILNVLPTSYMQKIEDYFCTYRDGSEHTIIFKPVLFPLPLIPCILSAVYTSTFSDKVAHDGGLGKTS